MRRVGRNLVRVDDTSQERRRVPDLLELMECTSAAAADADGSSAAAAAAAAGAATGRYSSSNKMLRFRRGSSNSSNTDAAAGSLSTMRRLDMRPERCGLYALCASVVFVVPVAFTHTLSATLCLIPWRLVTTSSRLLRVLQHVSFADQACPLATAYVL
jgi:hypothetical protein